MDADRIMVGGHNFFATNHRSTDWKSYRKLRINKISKRKFFAKFVFNRKKFIASSPNCTVLTYVTVNMPVWCGRIEYEIFLKGLHWYEHRHLNYDFIFGYFYVQVLDDGSIKEFDEPYELLKRTDSALSLMVAQTGKDIATHLKKMARTAHENRANMFASWSLRVWPVSLIEIIPKGLTLNLIRVTNKEI